MILNNKLKILTMWVNIKKKNLEYKSVGIFMKSVNLNVRKW